MHKSSYISAIFVPFSKTFWWQVWLVDNFCYFRPSGPFRFMGPFTLNSSKRHCFAGFRQYEITLEKRSPEDHDGFRYRCHINTRVARVAYSSISPVGFPIEVIEILMGQREKKSFSRPWKHYFTAIHCRSLFFFYRYIVFTLFFSFFVLFITRTDGTSMLEWWTKEVTNTSLYYNN